MTAHSFAGLDAALLLHLREERWRQVQELAQPLDRDKHLFVDIVVIPLNGSFQDVQPSLAFLGNGLTRGFGFNPVHSALSPKVSDRQHPAIVTRKQ
jgi:hypothetical protein